MSELTKTALKNYQMGAGGIHRVKIPAEEPKVPSQTREAVRVISLCRCEARVLIEVPIDKQTFEKITRVANQKAKQDLAVAEIADLAREAISLKIRQAHAEKDPLGKVKLYADAQMLLSEYLNMGRDPSWTEARRDDVRMTLRNYLLDVKCNAPYGVDLNYMYETHRTPEQSVPKLEQMVKEDAGLAALFQDWQARQKTLGLR